VRYAYASMVGGMQVMAEDDGKHEKHKGIDQGAAQTFITIKNESKGKKKSMRGAEIKRHAISRR